MGNKKRKFMIEINVSFNNKEELEHEGYYTSPDEAKEAIDRLYKMFNNEGIEEPETFCPHAIGDFIPRCLNYIEGGYCRRKTCG